MISKRRRVIKLTLSTEAISYMAKVQVSQIANHDFCVLDDTVELRYLWAELRNKGKVNKNLDSLKIL
jgi:hypothetical protein